MRHWMACWLATRFIYCTWQIHLSTKPNPKLKPKSKSEVRLCIYHTFHHQKKERQEKEFVYFQNFDFPRCFFSLFELLHTWRYSQRWSQCLALMKNVGMWTVCPVCSGLRHCEHIITIYVDMYVVYVYISMLFRKDVVALKILGKEGGGILIRSLFSWFICNNKPNVLIM